MKRLREGKTLSSMPEYRTWAAIKERCYNQDKDNYEHYGGKGIVVCDLWKDSFLNFYDYMGDKPTLKHQIDRIDNNGNYEPGNCRWVTTTENNRNRSNNKLSIEKVREMRQLFRTKQISYVELSKIYGVTSSVIGRIIRNKSWIETK